MNTRILEPEFNYHAPSTLREVLQMLAALPKTKILAGGTDLIVKMKTGGYTDIENMIDIKKVADLNYIMEDKESGALLIGALAKLSEIEKNNIVINNYTALYEALKAMAAISVRNMATMAGNICNSSPVADTVGPAICYSAKLTLMSEKGERQVAVEDFFTGPGTNVMAEDEMLTSITMPAQAKNTGAAFKKFTRVKPDISKISCTVVVTNDNGKASYCRIAMGSIAATPLYLKEISEGLVGKEITRDVIKKAAKDIADTIHPIDDNRTTAVYRKDITPVLVEEVFEKAWTRAGGVL